MWSWLFGTAEKEKKEEKTYTPEYLRDRGKELQKVDHSWRAKLQCFECLGIENARKHAGFDTNLLIAIKRQEAADRQALKEQQRLLLQDKNYLKKKYYERIDIDNSWTAFFCGKSYAREEKGFDVDTNHAIDTWEEENIGLFSSFNRLLNSVDNIDKPKEKKPVARNKNIQEIEKRQVERRKNMGRK